MHLACSGIVVGFRWHRDPRPRSRIFHPRPCVGCPVIVDVVEKLAFYTVGGRQSTTPVALGARGRCPTPWAGGEPAAMLGGREGGRVRLVPGEQRRGTGGRIQMLAPPACAAGWEARVVRRAWAGAWTTARLSGGAGCPSGPAARRLGPAQGPCALWGGSAARTPRRGVMRSRPPTPASPPLGWRVGRPHARQAWCPWCAPAAGALRGCRVGPQATPPLPARSDGRRSG